MPGRHIGGTHRHAEPDYGVRTPAGDIHLAQALHELDRRRVDMRAAIGSLGADAALLAELKVFEATAAMVGVIMGANGSLTEVEPLPAPGDE